MRFCDEGPFSLFLFFTFFSHGGGKGLSVACGVRLGMTVMWMKRVVICKEKKIWKWKLWLQDTTVHLLANFILFHLLCLFRITSLNWGLLIRILHCFTIRKRTKKNIYIYIYIGGLCLRSTFSKVWNQCGVWQNCLWKVVRWEASLFRS